MSLLGRGHRARCRTGWRPCGSVDAMSANASQDASGPGGLNPLISGLVFAMELAREIVARHYNVASQSPHFGSRYCDTGRSPGPSCRRTPRSQSPHFGSRHCDPAGSALDHCGWSAPSQSPHFGSRYCDPGWLVLQLHSRPPSQSPHFGSRYCDRMKKMIYGRSSSRSQSPHFGSRYCDTRNGADQPGAREPGRNPLTSGLGIAMAAFRHVPDVRKRRTYPSHVSRPGPTCSERFPLPDRGTISRTDDPPTACDRPRG
jgi:hypothetical protein